MPFSEDEIAEFKAEAEELLDGAEKSLMAIQRGESFAAHYDAIFRVFHSLKGAAGMMELGHVQAHMHQVESTFTEQKGKAVLEGAFVEFFLRATDACRALLEGEKVDFDYSVRSGAAPVACQTPAPAPAAAPVLRAAEPVKAPAAKTAPGPGIKVLLVDDEAFLVEILRDLLGDAGFEVCGTTDPEEALRLIETYRPDVVLSDISMPRITGHELLGRVKKAYPDLPVIFLSGHVDKEALMQGIANGVYAVIEKPFNHVQVVESCLNAAKKYRLTKLVQRSLNLLLYQFSDLDDFLIAQGKQDVRNSIRHELTALLEQVREMRQAENPARKAG
jgi:CheY-like chemotaxis protein/HPt (histidine-containing phosphotransfer) domain-containing protein